MSTSITSDEGNAGFQIAPMVDVVFVLMLFFMACAGSQVKELELSIILPSGMPLHNSEAPRVPIDIEISAAGEVSANGTLFGAAGDHRLVALREWLGGSFRRFGNADPVIIQPAADTRHERIVEVLNATAASGVRDLSFK